MSAKHQTRSGVPFVLALAIAAQGCATVGARHDNRDPRVGHLITQEQILRSGATNAWEAMKFTVRSHYFGDYRGQPVRITTNRGVGSLFLREEPLIFIDGARLNDIFELHTIPVSHLLRIRVLNGADGTTYFGTNATAGVILITTILGDIEPEQPEGPKVG